MRCAGRRRCVSSTDCRAHWRRKFASAARTCRRASGNYCRSRARAYNPRILVMDEATSSVDSETERLIQLALNELLADRTAVVIAHRLSTIERADRIMVLSGGVLRESGTHDELLAQRGLYYRLFELQYAAMANSDSRVAG